LEVPFHSAVAGFAAVIRHRRASKDARPSYDDVIGISLLSPCTFRMRRKRAASWERAALRLDRRSVYLLRGPSREEWQHSIPAVEELRYSITFRSVRHPAAR
jgi:alkylated DNA repair dioxygenase AlkB